MIQNGSMQETLQKAKTKLHLPVLARTLAWRLIAETSAHDYCCQSRHKWTFQNIVRKIKDIKDMLDELRYFTDDDEKHALRNKLYETRKQSVNEGDDSVGVKKFIK